MQKTLFFFFLVSLLEALEPSHSLPMAVELMDATQVGDTACFLRQNQTDLINLDTLVKVTYPRVNHFPGASERKVFHKQYGYVFVDADSSQVNFLVYRFPQQVYDISNMQQGLRFYENTEWMYSDTSKMMVKHVFYSNSHYLVKVDTQGKTAMVAEDSRTNRYFVKVLGLATSLLYLFQDLDLPLSSQTIYDSNFDRPVIDMFIAANGYYLATLRGAPLAFKVYKIETKEYIYQDLLQSQTARLNKLNETHMMVTVGGSIPSLEIYDLRLMQSRLHLQLPQIKYLDLDNVRVFLRQNTLGLWIRGQAVVNFYDIQFQPLPVTQKIQIPQCFPPAYLENGVCYLCDQSCSTCYQSNFSQCKSCDVGFQQGSDFKCVESQRLATFQNVLSVPMFKDVFQSSESLFLFIDRLWLFEYINMTMSRPIKGVFRLLRKTNEVKFFPPALSKLKQKKSGPLFPPAFNTGRGPLTPPMYLLVSKKIPNMLAYAEKVYLWGVLSTIATYICLRIANRILQCTCLSFLFKKYEITCLLIMQLLAPRVSFITFHATTELLTASSVNFSQKMSFLLCTCALFLVLIYSVSFYIILRWLNPRSTQTVFFCLCFKNLPATFVYLTWTNILLLIQSFVHAFFHFNAQLQLILLIGVASCNFALLVKSFIIFESLGQFFIYLFHQVSRLLFLLSLLFDIFGEDEMFQVNIETAEMILLILLCIFLHLQIFSNYFITVRRIWKKLTATDPSEPSPDQTNQNLVAIPSKNQVFTKQTKDNVFIYKNRNVNLAKSRKQISPYADILTINSEKRQRSQHFLQTNADKMFKTTKRSKRKPEKNQKKKKKKDNKVHPEEDREQRFIVSFKLKG